MKFFTHLCEISKPVSSLSLRWYVMITWVRHLCDINWFIAVTHRSLGVSNWKIQTIMSLSFTVVMDGNCKFVVFSLTARWHQTAKILSLIDRLTSVLSIASLPQVNCIVKLELLSVTSFVNKDRSSMLAASRRYSLMSMEIWLRFPLSPSLTSCILYSYYLEWPERH